MSDERDPDDARTQSEPSKPEREIVLALNGMMVVGPFPRQAPLPGSGVISMPEEDDK